MIWIDWIAATTLFLLGCVHNFVVAPMSYDSLTTTALWFVTGGITLWYAAIINFFWLRTVPHDRTTAILAALTNIVLLIFVLLFMYARQNWSDPINAFLYVPTGWLAARSLAAALQS